MALTFDQTGMASQKTLKGESMSRMQGLSRLRFLQILLASILVSVVLIDLTGIGTGGSPAHFLEADQDHADEDAGQNYL